MEPQQFVGQHQYANVDQQATPASFVAHLDRITALGQVLAYKRQTYELLRVQANQHILDVGCGAGDDALALAELVGQDGLVIGLDSSETMIQTARERAERAHLPVEFRLGDVFCLEFPDASFDGVRADRVMHHLAQYELAFAEMVRVTRPGGRIVVFEPDFDATLISSSDQHMARQVIHTYTDRFPQGQCGRHLYRLFKSAGLVEIAILPKTFPFAEVELAEQLIGLSSLVEEVSTRNPAQREHAESWLAEIKKASRDKQFFFMLLGLIVVGVKV